MYLILGAISFSFLLNRFDLIENDIGRRKLTIACPWPQEIVKVGKERERERERNGTKLGENNSQRQGEVYRVASNGEIKLTKPRYFYDELPNNFETQAE